MNNLRSILFGALVLLFTATAVAQGHQGERRGFDLEKMTEQLDLTPEQATQLKTIHEEQRTAFAKLAEGLPEGERPDREQMRTVMQDSREKMITVLTVEQQEKLKAERHKRGDGKKGNRNKPEMNEELRSELRAYRSETITPKFEEVRSAFDSKLSSTEKAQISKLREAVRSEFGEKGLKQLTSRGAGAKDGQRGGKTGHKAAGDKDCEPGAKTADCKPGAKAECKPGCESGAKSDSKKVGSREGKRTEMRAFMQKHKTDVQAVRDIARTHKTELAAVRTELEAAKVQWKKDGDAIRAKHLSAEELARYKARSEKRTEMRGKHKEQGNSARGSKDHNGESFSREDRGAFTFLLMDPASMNADGFEDANSSVSVYPNPAKDQTTVKFDVRTSGPVRVELVDASGKVLQTLLNATREVDTYELPVELPATMGKTGMIRITDAKGVRTVQLTRG